MEAAVFFSDPGQALAEMVGGGMRRGEFDEAPVAVRGFRNAVELFGEAGGAFGERGGEVHVVVERTFKSSPGFGQAPGAGGGFGAVTSQRAMDGAGVFNGWRRGGGEHAHGLPAGVVQIHGAGFEEQCEGLRGDQRGGRGVAVDRKSTRLNSRH